MEASHNNSRSIPVVDVTTDREAHPKRWYVVRVQMHCERQVAKRLNALGYETFLPIHHEIHQWSDRKKKVEKILIPLMVFLRVRQPDLKEIERLSYIFSFLKAPGEKKPAIIPDDQLERFKFMIGNCDSEISIGTTPLEKGDNVRVTRGSLKGLEGIVHETPDAKSTVSILLDCIGFASVQIDKSDLELIK